MSLLRKNIPSVSDALQELHSNQENLRLCEYTELILTVTVTKSLILHAVDMLEHLLELEHQFGNQPEYIPAIEDVLAYYQMVLQ
jgi:hypothetical protein